MPIPSNRFPALPAAAFGVLALLATMLVIVHPASAQTDTSSCATGVAVPDAANNPGLVSDCEALLASRDTLAGSAMLNWSADVPIAEWDGVTVGGTPERVTRIDLRDKGLVGTIPAELGRLASLRVLSLWQNQLTGTIPAVLSGLYNLTQLNLHSNRLSGEIPSELGNLSSMKSLGLSDNQLTGEIPSELGGLSNLQELSLSENQLSGPRYRPNWVTCLTCKPCGSRRTG